MMAVGFRLSAPLRISLLYVLAGSAWILLTDEQLRSVANMTPEAWLFSVGKGLFFVLVSSVLIFVLVRREVMRRQRSAARLEAVIAAAPLGIAVLDRNGAVRQWNPAAERLLGRSAADVRGRPAEEVGLALREATGTPVDREVSKADGTSVHVRIFVAALEEPPDGRLILMQDLTQSRAAEAAQLQIQKLDVVARLAGGVAHEFNNILTAVLGHATLLSESMAATDERREHAAAVCRGAARAAELTRQLLVLSGQNVTQPTLLNLTHLLEHTRTAMERVVGDAVHMELRLAADVWPVWCDASEFQQLVTDLLANARDAMPDGGTLRIETRNVTVDDPPADGMARGDYVLLRVADDGAGMDPATLEHLFEPFFTTKSEGAGLGLATVRSTARRYGARIRVTSIPQAGTSFDIFWPRGREPHASPRSPLIAGDEPGTVLIVEDDQAVRELATRVLRRAGHRVLVAASGEEALAIAAGTAFDLLVADIVMPGMSGVEVAERLRRDRPGLPILFTSGNAAGAIHDAAELYGAAFMDKPYDPAALADRVQHLLRRAAT